MRLIYIFAFGLVHLQLIYAIECYQCNSVHPDFPCAADKNNIVTCPSSENFCLYTVEEPQRLVMRACSTATHCEQALLKGITCELCTEDLCNGGTVKRVSKSLFGYLLIFYTLLKILE